MTFVAIQLIVVYQGNNAPEKVMKQQVLQSYVLADSTGAADWANKEITDGGLGDEAIEQLDRKNCLPGVYSFIGMFKLRGGKDNDEDAPHSQG